MKKRTSKEFDEIVGLEWFDAQAAGTLDDWMRFNKAMKQLDKSRSQNQEIEM